MRKGRKAAGFSRDGRGADRSSLASSSFLGVCRGREACGRVERELAADNRGDEGIDITLGVYVPDLGKSASMRVLSVKPHWCLRTGGAHARLSSGAFIPLAFERW